MSADQHHCDNCGEVEIVLFRVGHRMLCPTCSNDAERRDDRRAAFEDQLDEPPEPREPCTECAGSGSKLVDGEPLVCRHCLGSCVEPPPVKPVEAVEPTHPVVKSTIAKRRKVRCAMCDATLEIGTALWGGWVCLSNGEIRCNVHRPR